MLRGMYNLFSEVFILVLEQFWWEEMCDQVFHNQLVVSVGFGTHILCLLIKISKVFSDDYITGHPRLLGCHIQVLAPDNFA